MPSKHVSKYHLIIFDADGTLRRCTVEGQPCPNRAGEWELIPGVRERIADLDCHLGIASNQAGIALGYLTAPIALGLLRDLAEQAFGWERGNGLVHNSALGIRICPHGPRSHCACRKPKPGMLLSIMGAYGVSPRETLFVGDMHTDSEAAARACCDFEWASKFFGWEGCRAAT